MAAVNYIVEHEAFIEYAQDNGLSAAEQLLCYALCHIFNRRAQGGQWPDGFIRVTNKTVLSLLPFTEDTMAAARNRLKQRGVIDYVPGRKKAEVPMYKMIYFSVPAASEPEDPVFYPNNSGKQSGKVGGKDGGKPADILRKLNDTETETSTDDDDGSDARAQRELDLLQSLAEAVHQRRGLTGKARHRGDAPPGQGARRPQQQPQQQDAQQPGRGAAGPAMPDEKAHRPFQQRRQGQRHQERRRPGQQESRRQPGCAHRRAAVQQGCQTLYRSLLQCGRLPSPMYYQIFCQKPPFLFTGDLPSSYNIVAAFFAAPGAAVRRAEWEEQA